MATEVWWVDAPKNYKAGGYLTFKEHEHDVDEVFTDNNSYYSGFWCTKQWFFPLDLISDHYECLSYHFFLKFKVPTTTSGTLESADLFLRLGNAGMVMNVNPIYMDIDIYYRNVYNSSEFPWAVLDENDFPSGSWKKNDHSIEDFYNMWADFLIDGPHWLDPVDVTAGVQKAIDEGWEWIAFCFTPNYPTPLDWDWDDRPTSYDQKMWVGFFGAVTPYVVESPPGFPTSYASACPWLRITYSGGSSQYIPGEDVTEEGEGSPITCIAADQKSKTAIVGCESGSIWYTWSGGKEWDKMYEADDPISALYMDPIRNFLDYPYDEISYFGTESGHLYRSLNSLSTFDRIRTFTEGRIVEICGSHVDSNKLAVGVGGSVYTSVNGGSSWSRRKYGTEVTGLFVRGDEIQAVIDGAVWRSPNFGTTWYAVQGEPAHSQDIGFDVNDSRNMIIGCSGELYVFSGADDETYYTRPGAVIEGKVTQIDSDLSSSTSLIATDKKLYKSIDWGNSVHELLDEPIVDVAIGGNENVIYELPSLVSYDLLPNGDETIGTSTWTWKRCINGVGCEYGGDTLDGLWYTYQRDTYDITGKYCSWGNLWSGPSWILFYMENLPILASGVGISEVLLELNAAGGTSYANLRPGIKTHGTLYHWSPYRVVTDLAMATNPATLQPWTVSEVNSIVAGVGMAYDNGWSRGVKVKVYTEGTNVGTVGATPCVRKGTRSPSARTIILHYHPADRDGTVAFVDFYVASNITDLAVGVFSLDEYTTAPAGYYTSRAHTGNLGSYAPGLHRLYVNLPIKKNDFIGFYANGGSLYTSYPIRTGERTLGVSGNHVDASHELFSAIGSFGGSGENAWIPSFRGVIF
jgi:photosystem II stability/assembly factor-like uncharacterized protein